jgi:NAD(P)-dependent dehydrogenase (short-subunit alcohol dehydrogenase family)
MDDENGVAADIGDLEPLIKVAGMIGKPVRVGRRLTRFSHSDQLSFVCYGSGANTTNNLKGIWLCMKYEIPPMLKIGSGAIVNTASVVGLTGGRGFPA